MTLPTACEVCHATTLNPGPHASSGTEIWIWTEKGVRHVRCRQHVPRRLKYRKAT